MQSAQKSAEQMVTKQNETIKELRATNQMLKERVELNKKKRKDLTNVLNEYDERLKVNAVKEFVHSSRFEDGLVRVISPWFKNSFSFCTAQPLHIEESEYGQRNCFPSRTYVQYLEEEYLPSYTSTAKLPSPFKFLKDWGEEEEKDIPEGSRRSGNKR
ncbi:hypothetical protein Dimus_020860 [Dionaea muscipula]